MNQYLFMTDRQILGWLRLHSISLLRITLGIVFLWFGLLKTLGESPVKDLIAGTYGFLPPDTFVMVLGVWEILIGLGLIFKLFLRATIILLVVQMTGTFFSLVLDPQTFFVGKNLFLLTTLGEFVVKNIVLVSAGLVVAGHEIKESM